MHNVRIDRINRLVEQRISGTLDLAEVERSGAEMRRAVRSLDAGPGAHLSLYDLSEMSLPSEEVLASAFQQLADPRFTVVRARAPAATRDNMAVFERRADALRWLFAS